MSKLIPFSYGDNLIRVVNDEETGEQLWVARDICAVLEYKEVSKTVAKLDDDEKLTRKFFVSGQNREMLCVNESGLYTLILRSNKLEAKPFKRWVTHEVLPSIHKTGSYGQSQQVDLSPILELMQQQMQMMMQILENQKKSLESQKSLTPKQLDAIKMAVNKTARPLADRHNLAWGRAVREVYYELNGRMGVQSYYHIAPSDYEEALALLKRMREVKEQELETGETVKLGVFIYKEEEKGELLS